MWVYVYNLAMSKFSTCRPTLSVAICAQISAQMLANPLRNSATVGETMLSDRHNYSTERMAGQGYWAGVGRTLV